MNIKNILRLLGCIAVCFLAGAIGSFFTIPSINSWYATLNRPLLNPPNWVFGPVWSTLYLMMGISLYLAWVAKTNSEVKKKGLLSFGVQLVLNTLWSIVFFGVQSPFFAFLIIVALWLSILITIFYFYKTTKIAAYLLIPYLVWVSFAGFLNAAIFWLNR